MGRKKKHPNLPNGYGSIRKLSGNRRNPYAVHPPVTEFAPDGKPITHKALCYVSDWYVGFAVLTAYKAGTYTPGMEKDLVVSQDLSAAEMTDFVNKVLADYTTMTRQPEENETMTFEELYEKFYDWKYNGKRQYSYQSKASTGSAFKNCKALHKIKIDEITCEQMQEVIDSCPLKHASLENILSLMKQMYHYAIGQFLIDKDPTMLLKINSEDDDEHGVPFSVSDLEKLWDHEKDDVAQVLLILCYSGYRIMELQNIKIDLNRMYFEGGLKTTASKERIVPIHSAIQHIVKKRMEKYGSILPGSYSKFRSSLVSYLPSLYLDADHTSHDCRHTFSKLCEKYKVNENDRMRMLGHKFKNVTNDVYGHRDLEDLRKEIEKIPCHKCVTNGNVK